MYIVIYWTESDYSGDSEGWEGYDNFIDAHKRYIELLQDEDLLTASICRPIVSTDYETIQNPEKNDQ
jgi:hypothetical protein